MLQLLEGFVEEYFDQNPISQMGIIVTRNKRAELVCELAGNGRKHVDVSCHSLIIQILAGIRIFPLNIFCVTDNKANFTRPL